MVLIGDTCKMNDPKSFVQMFSVASLLCPFLYGKRQAVITFSKTRLEKYEI